MGKIINVSVDPGYNGTKVFVAGRAYRYDSVVISDKNQTLRNNGGLSKKKMDSRIAVLQDGTKYIVGEYAIEMKAASDSIENDTSVDDSLEIYGTTRFSNSNFTVLVNAAVVTSIIRAKEEGALKITDLDDISVNLIMALPHAYVERATDELIEKFRTPFSFDIEIGASEARSVKLTYNHFVTISQALLTLCGFAADDDGVIKESFDESFYPTLLVDCGYGTIGICYITAGGYVSEKSESNTRLAMKAVNTATSEKLREMGFSKSDNDVELMVTGQKKSVIHKTNKVDDKWVTEETNVAELHSEILRSVVGELVDRLFKEYDLDTKQSILVSGGTGTQYFPELQKKICESGILEEERVILTEATYGGKTYPSIFTVAIGGMKFLNGMVFE